MDQTLQQLYQVAPESFTAARNQLAKELAEAGSRDLAEKVRSRSKPTLATWALNQVGRESGEQLDALFDAGDRIRGAQANALRGKREGAEELRRASQEEQKLIALLLGRAAEAIRKQGHEPSPAALGRIEGTLRALALNPGDAREALKAGTLEKELQYSGFPGSVEVSQNAEITAKPKAAGKRDLQARDKEKEREEKKKAEAERRAAEREVQNWERKTVDSQANAARLEQIAARLEHSARAARNDAQRAKDSAEEDQRQLTKAKNFLASLALRST